MISFRHFWFNDWHFLDFHLLSYHSFSDHLLFNFQITLPGKFMPLLIQENDTFSNSHTHDMIVSFIFGIYSQVILDRQAELHPEEPLILIKPKINFIENLTNIYPHSNALRLF